MSTFPQNSYNKVYLNKAHIISHADKLECIILVFTHSCPIRQSSTDSMIWWKRMGRGMQIDSCLNAYRCLSILKWTRKIIIHWTNTRIILWQNVENLEPFLDFSQRTFSVGNEIVMWRHEFVITVCVVPLVCSACHTYCIEGSKFYDIFRTIRDMYACCRTFDRGTLTTRVGGGRDSNQDFPLVQRTLFNWVPSDVAVLCKARCVNVYFVIF